MIELQKINKGFPGVQALDEVSFQLNAGEIHAIAGENGAGKSTLIKILSGAYRKDTGRILFDEVEVHQTSPQIMQHRGIQTMYQERNLIPWLTVAENILISQLPGEGVMPLSWKKLYAKAESVISDLGLNIPVRKTVSMLSPAEQQLVEIAKAFSASNCRVLIMDEPTSSLNDHETSHLFDLIRSIRGRGVSVVYISHHLEELFEIADRITVLRDGQTVGTYQMSEMSKESIIRLMAGEKQFNRTERTSYKNGHCRLKVNGLVPRGGKPVSFSINAGEVLCLGGMVGSGRSEIALTLFGALPAESGAVSINGKELIPGSPVQAKSAGIGLLPEERKYDGIIPYMDIKKNITLAAIEKIEGRAGLNLRREEQAAGGFQDSLRIVTSSLDKEIRLLSGGNQQKVVLAKWLYTDADILILDEPTKGIDIYAKQEIYIEIQKLAEEGKAVLIISSDLEEILQIADRVLVMKDRKINGELEGEEITAANILHYALHDSAEEELNGCG